MLSGQGGWHWRHWRPSARGVSGDATPGSVLPTEGEGEPLVGQQLPRRRFSSASLGAVAAAAALLCGAGVLTFLQTARAHHPKSSASVTSRGSEQLWSWNPIDWFRYGWGGDEPTSTTTTFTTTFTTTVTTTTTHIPFPDFWFNCADNMTGDGKLTFKAKSGTPAFFIFKGAAHDEKQFHTDCAGVGGNCWSSKCCQQYGLYCFEKQPGVAGCKASCEPGPDLSDHDSDPWTCKPLGDHTGEKFKIDGPLAPWVDEECVSNKSMDTCRSSGCCKDAGMRCYEKSVGHARCRASCTPGVDPTDVDDKPWSCRALGPRTPGPIPDAWVKASSWVDDKCSSVGDNCFHTGCCRDEGMQCYIKDSEEKKAGCLPRCMKGPQFQESSSAPWSCEPLGGRTPGVIAEPRNDVPEWVANDCAKSGENCTASQCCAEPGNQCFIKSNGTNGTEAWAACKAECAPGPNLFDVDSTPWSCETLGQRTPGEAKWLQQDVSDWAKKNCSKLGGSCQDSRCCRDPGMQCYAKDDFWATCKATCDIGASYFDESPMLWSCKELGPRTPGKATIYKEPIAAWAEELCSASGDGNCLETACCKDDGMQCYRKNASYGECKQTCSMTLSDPKEHGAWSCEEVGLRHPGTPPCVEDNEDCSVSKCCKSKGKMCFEKDDNWATCLDSCDNSHEGMDDWSCRPLGVRQYGRELGCAWAGDDCGLVKQCCQEGFSCLKKDDHFAGCVDKAPEGENWIGDLIGSPRVTTGTVGIDGDAGSNSIESWPGHGAGTRLYCFMVVMYGTAEEQLMNFARDRQASIFQCEVNDVLTGHSAKWDDWGSFANTAVFVDIWKQVIATNRFSEADWTVKVDPDTVFFPDRLRSAIGELQPPAGEPVYLKNTHRFNGFLGAIEIFTREAVELYAEFGVYGCHMLEEGSGEDGYFKGCMDAIGAKFMMRDRILKSDGNPKHCDSDHVVFHPFKELGGMQQCYDKVS